VGKVEADHCFGSLAGFMLKRDELPKEDGQKTRRFAPGQTLQNTRQADSAELLARRPPEHRLHRMLSNAGSAVPQQTTVPTSRPTHSAVPLVVRVPHQGMCAVFQGSATREAALRPARPPDLAE